MAAEDYLPDDDPWSEPYDPWREVKVSLPCELQKKRTDYYKASMEYSKQMAKAVKPRVPYKVSDGVKHFERMLETYGDLDLVTIHRDCYCSMPYAYYPSDGELFEIDYETRQYRKGTQVVVMARTEERYD